uniref:Uncharacterized protein n=1 Tax=viral metagenome TaxID=1070528 RepID=A0A6C0AJL0_9ZZZZ
MLEVKWVIIGILTGLVIGCVFVPPTRKSIGVPSPGSKEVFHTDTGCVRFDSTEVPCTAEPDSMNLLASQK